MRKVIITLLAVGLIVLTTGCSVPIPDSMMAEYTLNKEIYSEIEKQAVIKSNITDYISQLEVILNCNRNDSKAYTDSINGCRVLSEQYKIDLLSINNENINAVDSIIADIESRETEEVDTSASKPDNYTEYKMYNKTGEIIGVTPIFEEYQAYQKEVWGQDITLENYQDEQPTESTDNSGLENSSTAEEIVIGEYTIYNNKIVFKCINKFNVTSTIIVYIGSDGKVVNMLGY